MSDSGATTKSVSDFMAAEQIKKILDGREPAEQERIVRWVSESLNIASKPATPSPASAIPLSQHSTPSAAGASNLPAMDNRQRTIKAFIQEKRPKSDMQFATAVAYFYRFEAPVESRRDSITAKDLQEASRQAGRDRFKAPNVPLNNAVKQGYLDRGDRGQFVVNAVGENLVAMSLPASSEAREVRRRRNSAKRPPSAVAGKKSRSA